MPVGARWSLILALLGLLPACGGPTDPSSEAVVPLTASALAGTWTPDHWVEVMKDDTTFRRTGTYPAPIVSTTFDAPPRTGVHFSDTTSAPYGYTIAGDTIIYINLRTQTRFPYVARLTAHTLETTHFGFGDDLNGDHVVDAVLMRDVYRR